MSNEEQDGSQQVGGKSADLHFSKRPVLCFAVLVKTMHSKVSIQIFVSHRKGACVRVFWFSCLARIIAVFAKSIMLFACAISHRRFVLGGVTFIDAAGLPT